ncbi:MAG: hypothetical protein MPJ24_06225 [Pirellulaceae bacterium]|nr:hypothetical protein [Pirellulaceae bacterium]
MSFAQNSYQNQQKFIELLRDRGYHDTVFTYYSELKRKKKLSEEAAALEDYESGLSYLNLASREGDKSRQASYFQKAEESLKRFAIKNPQHPSIFRANKLLIGILDHKAFEQQNLALTEPNGAQKEIYFTNARNAYAQAAKLAKATEAIIKRQLEKIPAALNPSTEPDLFALRQELRSEYIHLKMLNGEMLEKQGDTHKTLSQKSPFLTQSAEQFRSIATDYRKYAGGLKARLAEGRVLQKLEKHQEAIFLFEEILALDDDQDLTRNLKTEAVLLAIESWPQTNALIENYIRKVQNWEATILSKEERLPSWQHLRLSLMKLHLKNSEHYLASDKKSLATKEQKAALRLGRILTQTSGPYQQEARLLLLSLDATATEQDPIGVKNIAEFKTFDEAYQAALDLQEQYQAAQFGVEHIPARIQKEKNPQLRKEYQQTLDEQKEIIETTQKRTEQYLRRALELVDNQSPILKVNHARLKLAEAYLQHPTGYHREATVLAEFVARKYPDKTTAKSAFQLGLVGYQHLLQETSQETARKYYEKGLIQLAHFGIDQWPGSEQAAIALKLNIHFAILRQDFVAADKYLEKIPPENLDHYLAKALLGSAYWREYQKQRIALLEWEKNQSFPEGTTPEKARAKLNQEFLLAERHLTEGTDYFRDKKGADSTVATASLSLAQLYLEQNKLEKAKELFTHPNISPLVLLKIFPQLQKRPVYVASCHQAFLQICSRRLAQTGKLSPRESDNANTAILALADINKTSDSAAKNRLLYFLLRQTQTALDPLDQQNKTLSSTGRDFLEKLLLAADQQAITSLNKLQINSQRMKLAKLLPTTDRRVTLQNAQKELNQIPYQQLEANLQIEFFRHLAAIERFSGNYEKAIDIYANKVLYTKGSLLDVQMEAAETYEEWALASGNSEYYRNAIFGGTAVKGKKKIIWGWQQLAKQTGSQPTFSQQHMQSFYHVVLCQYRLALHDKSQQKSMLEKARQYILTLHKQKPELGGPNQKAQFQDLLTRIEHGLGKKELTTLK